MALRQKFCMSGRIRVIGQSLDMPWGGKGVGEVSSTSSHDEVMAELGCSNGGLGSAHSPRQPSNAFSQGLEKCFSPRKQTFLGLEKLPPCAACSLCANAALSKCACQHCICMTSCLCMCMYAWMWWCMQPLIMWTSGLSWVWLCDLRPQLLPPKFGHDLTLTRCPWTFF